MGTPTPPPEDAEPRGLCKILPVQRLHHPLGALWLVLLQEDPPGSGDCGLIQRGKGSSCLSQCGAHCLVHPYQTLSSTTVQSGDPSLLRLQDVTSAQVPRPEQNRLFSFVLFFFFGLSIFATYFELEYIDSLHCGGCFFLGVQQLE